MSHVEADTALEAGSYKAGGVRRRLPVAVAAGAGGIVAIAALLGMSTLVLAVLAIALLIVVGFCAGRTGPVDVAEGAHGFQAGKAIIFPESVRALLECLEDPLLVLDGTQRVVFANHAARPLAGADFEGKHITAVLRTPGVLEAVAR